jgi:hypothetical protein
MAHYAFLDERGIVTEVIVGRDENEGVDWESHYAAVRGQRCKRTSYHTQGGVHHNGGVSFRGNYAGIGYQYMAHADIFAPPCPGEGWVLDEATAAWVPATDTRHTG